MLDTHMSSNSWDAVYSKKQMAQYPDTALVRFIARNFYSVPDRSKVKILDVGCGVGASTWYLSREGFSVTSVDGSKVAIDRLRHRLKQDKLQAMTACIDLTELELQRDYFDCVVDISSLCYVSGDKIVKVMNELFRVLKPKGKLFSLTPSYSCSKDPFNHTIEDVDLNSRFLTYEEAQELYKRFSKIEIQPYTYGCKEQRISLWEIHALKE